MTGSRKFAPTTKILKVGLRLSVVVAVLVGLADTYSRYSEALREHESSLAMRQGYECAARARDDDLLKARDASGNINIKGAPFYCASRDFWVAMHEIEMVRAGTMDFSNVRLWFHWPSTAMAAGLGLVATNLLALLIAGTFVVARWVLSPVSNRH